MGSVISLYAVIGALGATSGLFVLLRSKKHLTTRNITTTCLGGFLFSIMVVSLWYGDPATDPWKAIGMSIAVGASQPWIQERFLPNLFPPEDQ